MEVQERCSHWKGRDDEMLTSPAVTLDLLVETEEQADSIELLAQYEEAGSQLHRAYGARFPSLQGFWSTLSREEEEQARQIRSLRSLIKERALLFHEERFNGEMIRYCLGYLTELTAKVQRERLLLVNVFLTAWYIQLEKFMIEKKFALAFHLCHLCAVDEEDPLEALYSVTREHMRRIEEAWAESRQHPSSRSLERSS